MAKILVSGGAGFIGSHVVDLLVEKGNKVLIVDDFSTGDEGNITHHSPEKVLRIACDIRDMRCLRMAFIAFKPTRVIHLAAQAAISTAINDPEKDLSVNGGGTLNMLRLAKEFQVKKFVYASTSAVYASQNEFLSEVSPLREGSRIVPENEYGISKLTGENYVRIADLPTTVLRFGNVYGPRQVPIGENQVIARMIRHFEFGDHFEIFGDGFQKRDFVFVRDVARAVVMATFDVRSNIYNVASGKSISVNQLAKTIERIYNAVGYKWSWNYDKADSRSVVKMNVSRARRWGWSPKVKLVDGLKETIEWVKKENKGSKGGNGSKSDN